ncbi:MAG: hypothetical protein JNJ83_23485 [Verrucomicrobiaceae bacterium]|nr:hypothetical protein [Verrucomicrobiaceae bacterium]
MKTETDFSAVEAAAYECAVQMLHNGRYILEHLHEVTMPADLRREVEAVSNSFVDTKHDVIHDLFEMRENEQDTAYVIQVLQRVIDWLSETVAEMHEVVQKLHATEDSILASLLVTGSATYVMLAFGRVKKAADLCQVFRLE